MKIRSTSTSMFAGGALLALTLAAPSFAADKPDAWVTTKSTVAVLGAVGTGATGIRVETTDGLVTLHGTVVEHKHKRH